MIHDYMLNPFPNIYDMFPISIHHIAASWPVEHVLHWHEEIEIIYQHEGTGFFQAGATIYTLEPGQALLVNSEEYHSTFHPGYPSTGLIYCIGFKPNVLNSGNNDICQTKYIDPIIQKHHKFPCIINGEYTHENIILNNIKEIINYFNEKQHGFELAIKVLIHGIFMQLIINNRLETVEQNEVISSRTKVQRLKSILDYIHTSYDKKFTYKDIAASTKMTQAHFCRFFKSMMGKTPMEYTNQLRINKVALLLCDKNRKIIDIAMEVGFENLGHFIKTFKQLKKCTPSEYRSMYENDGQNGKVLPGNWRSKHVGSSVKAGSASFKDDIFTVSGMGDDIGLENDEFQFVYQQVEGDFSITSRVISITRTEAWSKAGVMIREVLDPVSMFAHTVITPLNGVAFEVRIPQDKFGHNIFTESSIKAPAYVRLTRTGDLISAHYSIDGLKWDMMEQPENIPMNKSVFTGLVVTSHNYSIALDKVCTALFDNVKIEHIP